MKKKEEKTTEKLRDCYYTIIDILKKYCDLEERYYPIIALWIIGTYTHDEFQTFPYLFLNAPKGAGKSRTLLLIITLSHNGRMVGSLTESVLFRTAKGRTFGLDELEDINSKEKNALRALLNSAYKKGLIIERSIKRKTKEGEGWDIEAYDVYTAIVMANIWGMEEVLADRCITLILEKSSDRKITKLIENFENEYATKKIKKLLEETKDELQSLCSGENIAKIWNDFITGKLRKKGMNKKMLSFLEDVNKLNIEGRNLELLFPLYFLSYLIDKAALKNMLKTSQEIVKEREEEDYFENKDRILIRFLSEKLKEGNLEYKDFISSSKVANQFKLYLGEETEWINSIWIGKALKRLKLIKGKERVAGGMRILLNLEKTRKKAQLYTKS